MSDKVRDIIARHIGSWLCSYGDPYSYHTPNASWRDLLKEQEGDAQKVADSLLQDLRNHGIVGFVDQNATLAPRVYTDADAEAWVDSD